MAAPLPDGSLMGKSRSCKYLKSTYSDVSYGYARSTFNKMEQASAYLKVAWQLNIGKKVNPESNNSSRIYPSSIMK